MKNIWILLKRFVPGYRGYIVATFLLNVLAMLFNLISFGTIIPILQILFGMTESAHSYTDLSTTSGLTEWVNAVKDNAMYYIEQMITEHGATTALMWIAMFLVCATFVKAGVTFAAAATLVPIRTGVLRDIRNQIYRKMVSLPIGYYSEERKGDILSRMTNDVAEVEASIMSSLEMLF